MYNQCIGVYSCPRLTVVHKKEHPAVVFSSISSIVVAGVLFYFLPEKAARGNHHNALFSTTLSEVIGYTCECSGKEIRC